MRDDDDVDVYLIRAGAETFERPINGTHREWILGEPLRKAQYVTLSQIVSFPLTTASANSQLIYRDEERGVLVGVPTGYAVLQLLPDSEIVALKAAKRKSDSRQKVQQ